MEFLATILGVAGLIWGTVLLKRGGLLACCLAVMLAGAVLWLGVLQTLLGTDSADCGPAADGRAGGAISRLAAIRLGRSQTVGQTRDRALPVHGRDGHQHFFRRLHHREQPAGGMADYLLSDAFRTLLDRAAGVALRAGCARPFRFPHRFRRLFGYHFAGRALRTLLGNSPAIHHRHRDQSRRRIRGPGERSVFKSHRQRHRAGNLLRRVAHVLAAVSPDRPTSAHPPVSALCRGALLHAYPQRVDRRRAHAGLNRGTMRCRGVGECRF